MTASDAGATPTARTDGAGDGPVVLALRRNAFSPAVLVVGFALLVVLPLAVAIAIAVTVLGAGSTVGGVAVGLVVPLALLAFASGVARPLLAGRKVHIVLRADALVLADKGLFHSAEAIPRHAVRDAHLGPAVDGWLAARDPADEVGLAPDDEPVDLLLVFDELVVLDHARRKASRPKGEHRSALPRPEQPVGHLWIPLADPDGASRALAGWLPHPPAPAPVGTPPPDLG